MTNSEPVSKDRRLGQTGIELSAVGLGCWQFSKGRGMTGRYWPSLDDQIISQIVERSLTGLIQPRAMAGGNRRKHSLELWLPWMCPGTGF